MPSTGSVALLGQEISRLPAHRRARVGLGRTFQAATLFPELTVRETVQLALEARERTSFWGSLLWVPSVRPERRKRAEAAELIDYLGLGRYADRFIAELSTGTRRIVELTTVLAVSPRVICLDEPTAGVAQREAEAFGPLIKRVQQRARRDSRRRRARPPTHLVDQRPRVLPRGRCRHCRGQPHRRPQQPPRRQQLPRHRRTSDPTQ